MKAVVGRNCPLTEHKRMGLMKANCSSSNAKFSKKMKLFKSSNKKQTFSRNKPSIATSGRSPS